MSKPILCVDFDGVIHAYTTPWTNAVTISDGPVPGALRWLYAATEHFDVKVYSSRSKEIGATKAMRDWMTHYAAKEFGGLHPLALVGHSYPVTFAHEKPAAFLTIDDRAVCFDGDWSKLQFTELKKFKPWNKKTARTRLDEDAAAWLTAHMDALGTPVQAINFACDLDDLGNSQQFLRDWREGNIGQWPEYSEWLQEADNR